MTIQPAAVGVVPPLTLKWRSTTAFSIAVAGNDTLYGVTSTGRIVALAASDGSKRWETSGSYVSNRLSIQGKRLFAYRLGDGLTYIDDVGTSATEQVSLGFAASTTTNMSTPVVDGRMVYVAVNQGLYAGHQEQGLQFGAILSELVPHSVGLVGSGDVIVVNGKGVPSRYRVTSTAFELVWTGMDNGVNAGLTDRPFTITGNLVVVGVGPNLVAYDLTTGAVAWMLGNVPTRALTSAAGIVYAAFHGAALWAIEADDGNVLWQRQYMYNIALQREYGVAVVGDYVYFGGALQLNPDGAVLLAVHRDDGSLAWMSRAAGGNWAAGIPVSDGTRIYSFGTSHSGAYSTLGGSPKVLPEHFEVTPRPLRGPMATFEAGTVQVDLPVSAQVTMSLYREEKGLGTKLISAVQWSAGTHEVSWKPANSGGFSDEQQFGYILVDVTEPGGSTYSQALLIPVNTFPDILWHWGRENIEVMAYHRYVNGYEDQTFKPNGLVTRAESSTIIAKTLGLSTPSAGFESKFTDMDSHWSRNYVLALEERGIISGFEEPDGTYTFRPELNMTRGQEARILVKAYNIPTAPPNFVSRFTDINGHWAAPDIKALEAAGYVSGFEEDDGSFSYRPEQNLTRAELCTVVVRIRKLSR